MFILTTETYHLLQKPFDVVATQRNDQNSLLFFNAKSLLLSNDIGYMIYGTRSYCQVEPCSFHHSTEHLAENGVVLYDIGYIL